MNALPIVGRELLVRARQRRTHWTRVIVAAFGVSTTLFLFLSWGGGTADMTGQAGLAFHILAWLGFIGTCLGFLLTVDCLSSERRAGTLGLLMLTRVDVVGVLCGKLAANGLTAMFGLLALVPALMLPVLAGGVIGAQVVRVVAACFSMLVFTLCLGLYVSSQSRRFGEALARFMVWFGLAMIVTLMAGVCPLGAFLDSDASRASGVGGGFWAGTFSGPLLGLLFLGLAGRSLRGNWQNQEERRVASPLVSLEAASNVKSVGDLDPVVWLLKRDMTRVAMIWIAAFLGFLSVLLNIDVVRPGGVGASGGIGAAGALAGVGSAVLFAAVGARFMVSLKKSGTFELLHATRIGISRLGAVQRTLLRSELFIPLLFLSALALIQRMVVLNSSFGSGLPALFVSVLSGPLELVMSALALCSLGMWFGLRSRGSFTAILWSVGLVVGGDLAIHAGFLGLYAVASAAAANTTVPTPLFSFIGFVILPVATILKQVFLMQWARRQLDKRLAGGCHWSVLGVGSTD